MIGTTAFDGMKTSTILVGISRGGVIDEDALVNALATGSIKAAALDVFDQEPLPEESPLWDIPNLLITPHAAGGSQYEADSLREIFVENVTRFVRGDFPLRNQVDKEAGY
jgi:phosphoglycerate dehydrogenase-like enzyme